MTIKKLKAYLGLISKVVKTLENLTSIDYINKSLIIKTKEIISIE